jgi:hypothetical protein
VSEYMQSAIPGDWENVAKAYQNREPSTTNPGLSKWANAAYVGDLQYDFSGLKECRHPDGSEVAVRRRPVRGADGLLVPRRRHPERGGVLPAAALRRPAAGDGAHAVRQRRPLAGRVRARPGEDLPLLGLAPQGGRPISTATPTGCSRARTYACCGGAR